MRFATPSVHTVDPASFRPWLTDAEWQCVEVLIDPRAFEERVLQPDWQARAQQLYNPDARWSVRLSREQVEDLIAKRYLTPTTGPAACPCGVFAVVKSDNETLRLIWNGVLFNSLCRDPPRFSITALPLMLSKLLHPDVRYYIVWDYATWFVQLKCHPGVRRFFTTRVGRQLYELAGAPMGWDGACAVAQALTAAFTRALLAELSLTTNDITCEFCIDNTIWAVRCAVEPDTVTAALRRVAARFNVVIKKDSITTGPSVEWLTYALDVRTRTAVFKDAYKEKLRAAVRLVRNGYRTRAPTVLEVWSICGLLIFSRYAARGSLRDLKPILLWLQQTAREALADSTVWTAQRPMPEPRLLREALERLVDVTIAPPPLPGATVPDAWTVSDAAGGADGRTVWLVFTRASTTLRVYACPSTLIAERELCGLVGGCDAAVTLASHAGCAPRRIVSYTDNEVARAAAARGYSVTAADEVAARLEQQEASMVGKQVSREVYRVPGERCIADAWTRKLPNGAPVPFGLWSWPRTCAHDWVPLQPCTCVRAALATTGADMSVFERWSETLPTGADLRDPRGAWHAAGIVEVAR